MQEQIEWLTVSQVARQLGVSQSTIKNWCHWGWLEHLKVGHTIRIHPDAHKKLVRKVG